MVPLRVMPHRLRLWEGVVVALLLQVYLQQDPLQTKSWAITNRTRVQRLPRRHQAVGRKCSVVPTVLYRDLARRGYAQRC